MKARIVIGANYGDESKGTIVARYTRNSDDVLNVLTNGGAQRGHSVLLDSGNSVTYSHFGSGTCYGADTYYSRFFIINPTLFTREHESLIIKPRRIYRDERCRWSTIFDMMANQIAEEQKKRHASCCVGIWNTVKRYTELPSVGFSAFIGFDAHTRWKYLESIKKYYERHLTIPYEWKDIWNSDYLCLHFINDCIYMHKRTIVANPMALTYENVIFENGQGLLLCDNGADTYDTTPSNTGIGDALEVLKEFNNVKVITAHYVSRTYLTRHGDGPLINEADRTSISSDIKEDRTNHYNDGQGEFRYGALDIEGLHDRIVKDAGNINFKLELTHCDELDNVNDVKKVFGTGIVNAYGSPLV